MNEDQELDYLTDYEDDEDDPKPDGGVRVPSKPRTPNKSGGAEAVPEEQLTLI